MHTPGPWTVNEDTGEIEAHCMVLGNVYGAEDFPCCEDDEGLQECKANALLIAAAPDLLEALKDVLDAFDCLGECDCEGSSLCAVCNAQNAIAKAEGVK